MNKLHQADVRSKIQASQLINRLQNFIEGKISLNAAQVNAALGLLRKSLPDLQATEHSGEIAYSLSGEISALNALARDAKTATEHASQTLQ